MADKNDPLGYYAALNVSPGATHHEVRLGYKFIKEAHREGKKSVDVRKVQEAFDVLSDPSRRAAYDRGEIQGEAWWRNLRWIPHGLIAGVVLFIVFAVQVRPADGSDPRWYPAPDLDRYFEIR